MNDLAHALMFFGETIVVCLAIRAARRARNAAAEAQKAERLAWLHTANTEDTLRRLEAMLPPDVITFEPPAAQQAEPARETEARAEEEPRAVLPFRPRLWRPSRSGGGA